MEYVQKRCIYSKETWRNTKQTCRIEKITGKGYTKNETKIFDKSAIISG